VLIAPELGARRPRDARACSTYQYTFKTPGTYNVQCLVHGAAMPLTITVQ
jgi:plastocyanin